MGVFTALFLIEAYHVAAILHPDFLDFERRRVFRLLTLGHALKPRATVAQHLEANFLLPTHAYPDDVAHRRHAAFEGRQGRLAHHASVGHHRDLP
jgi:hypothetical protein